MFEDFPYTNFHDLNLDWLIQKIMEAYGPDNPPPVGLVLSVNGETGAVVLYKDAIVRLPDIEEASWNIHRLADGNSSGIEFINGQPAMRIDGIHRYKIYDEGNPPPASQESVSSVDGMTGNVKTWANTSNPTLDVPEESSGFLWDLRRGLSNGDQIGIEFEYDSVNQVYKTFLKYTPYQGTATRTELLTSASLPPSAGVVSVNGQTGIVSIYGDNIPTTPGSQYSVKDKLDELDELAEDVSDIETAITNLNGSNIPIETNSQQTIKEYINSKSNNHRSLQTIITDGTKSYNEILNTFYPIFQNVVSENSSNALYITMLIGTHLFTVSDFTRTELQLISVEQPIIPNYLYRGIILRETTSQYTLRTRDGNLDTLTATIPPTGQTIAMYI